MIGVCVINFLSVLGTVDNPLQCDIQEPSSYVEGVIFVHVWDKQTITFA